MLAFLLAFLFPVAVYCLVLGLINRRDRPLIVSGPWDFAGVLFAASGLLMYGGPALLGLMNERWRFSALLAERRSEAGFGAAFFVWLLLSVLYFMLVVGGAAFLLWCRRGQTAVYNVSTAVFDPLLARVLEGLGLSWSQTGRRLFLGHGVSRDFLAEALEEANPEALTARRPRPPLPALEPLRTAGEIEVDAFPSMQHVTIYWCDLDEPLRQEIERELAFALTRVRTPSNPAAAWLLTAASSLFCLMFFLAIIGVVLPSIVGK